MVRHLRSRGDRTPRRVPSPPARRRSSRPRGSSTSRCGPRGASLAVRVNGATTRSSAATTASGWHSGGRHGDEYVYVVDGEALAGSVLALAARRRARAVARARHCRVRVATPEKALRSTSSSLYELHVGTFSREGTFDGAIPHLRELRELGVTAVEVMPVATFPGERGWGYDGLYTSAPHRAYGGPEGLARFVDAAHERGARRRPRRRLQPRRRRATRRSPRSARTSPTATRPSGATRSTTRSRRCASGRSRTPSCGCATTASTGCASTRCTPIFDDAPTHVLAELAERVRAIDPRALVISEMRAGDLPADRGVGPRRAVGRRAPPRAARAADRRARRLLRAATARSSGLAARARARRRPSGSSSASQNHDQVGNRAARRPACRADELRVARRRDALRAADAAAVPGRGVRRAAPFQFFTDHNDPAIAEATREGRRREFAALRRRSPARTSRPAGARDVRALEARPRRAADEELRAFYRELIALRRELPRASSTTDVDEAPHPARAPRRRASSSPTSTRRDRRSSRCDEGLARRAVPARPDVGRRRHELLALLGERRARRALPLRRGRQRDARSS